MWLATVKVTRPYSNVEKQKHVWVRTFAPTCHCVVSPRLWGNPYRANQLNVHSSFNWAGRTEKTFRLLEFTVSSVTELYQRFMHHMMFSNSILGYYKPIEIHATFWISWVSYKIKSSRICTLLIISVYIYLSCLFHWYQCCGIWGMMFAEYDDLKLTAGTVVNKHCHRWYHPLHVKPTTHLLTPCADLNHRFYHVLVLHTPSGSPVCSFKCVYVNGAVWDVHILHGICQKWRQGNSSIKRADIQIGEDKLQIPCDKVWSAAGFLGRGISRLLQRWSSSLLGSLELMMHRDFPGTPPPQCAFCMYSCMSLFFRVCPGCM